jgi:transaldolase
MKATQKLQEIGQSLWLDNITRGLLASGTLQRYIQELSITGLTSNPTIFDHAIKNSQDYDEAISQKLKEGRTGEALFFELAIEDLRQAADLFLPIHDRTDGVDGWVSWRSHPCWLATHPWSQSAMTGSCQILNSDPQNGRSYTTSVVLGVPHGFISR